MRIQPHLKECASIRIRSRTDDGYDVRSSHLEVVQAAIDAAGNPSIEFAMTELGEQRLRGLTTEYARDAQTGFQRRLAILLDNCIFAAPTLRGAIGGAG